ncbi:MAG: lipid-A-disaccharide synthase [Endomicrobia bacterium]|nr:lipid-A-disaccharide synthase [Endomicrobiia bacterium]MCL2507486.1 lipid-A-disaccharide synthase [Endomicrobiia bacterium]
MANNKIFISAGDLSGEIHAANLAREIKKINPQCQIYALGGNNLKSVSDIFIEDIVNINAFGFLPIKQFFFLKKLLQKLENFFLSEKPDKIILADYYGFHIVVAKLAKKLNIPVYYYISPQVWASRSYRIKTLAETVKKMFVILPFEEELYRKSGVDAVFVGNPLIDIVPVKQNFEITKPPLIGLFPGSRKSVIKRHLPIILETAKILKEKLNADFMLFSVNKDLGIKLPDYIKFEPNNDFSKRETIDIAVCPSGTVSLENALMGIPMTVMYKLSYFNYFLARLIVKVKYITIVNILADKKVVPEFIQFDATPEKIAASIIEQLKPDYYASKTQELADFRKMLGTTGVSKRVAEMILNDSVKS